MLIEAEVTCASIHKPNRKCNPLKLGVQALDVYVIDQGQALGLCVCVCVYVLAHVIRYCNFHAVSVGN
jgi:hypothetical protein